MCLFSIFLLNIFMLLNKRFVWFWNNCEYIKNENIFSSSNLTELISIKEIKNEERQVKSGFSCDSLSLISCETTRKDIEDEISSFYLQNYSNLKQNPIINSLPSIKLRPILVNENKQINTLPHLSTHRSIIKDINYLSNSFKQNRIHQSIDSLFSKDSLVE